MFSLNRITPVFVERQMYRKYIPLAMLNAVDHLQTWHHATSKRCCRLTMNIIDLLATGLASYRFPSTANVSLNDALTMPSSVCCYFS
jgi:hypothetical protein